MEIIVADANIFVYLFHCNLLNKFLSNQYYAIKVTQTVQEEITAPGKRIPRDHPELRKRMLDIIHNSSSSEKLEVVNIDIEMENLDSLKVFYKLDGERELDRGETESIPLAFDLNAKFLSNDEDAINVANEIKEGLGINFMSFCKNMSEKCIISPDDLQSIENFMEKY